MVKYHGRGLDTERQQRYITSFNTVQTASQDRFAVTSETKCMVSKTYLFLTTLIDHSNGTSISGTMDAVTAGAEDVLQNKKEDRIEELVARPYQV